MAGEGNVSIIDRFKVALSRPKASVTPPPEANLSPTEIEALKQRFPKVPTDDSMNQAEYAVHWIKEHGIQQEQGVTLTPIEDVLRELTGKTINATGTSLTDLAIELRQKHGVLLNDEQVDIESLRDRMVGLVSEQRMGFVLDMPSDPGYKPEILSDERKGTNKVTFKRGEDETLVVEYKGDVYGPMGKFIYTRNSPSGTIIKEIFIDGGRLHRDFRIVTFQLDDSGRRVPLSIHEYGPIPVVQRLYDADTTQEVSEFESIFNRLVRREKVS